MQAKDRNTFYTGILLLLIGDFLFGSLFVAGQYGARLIPPWQLGFLRIVVAILVLLPFVYRELSQRWGVVKQYWRVLFMLGFLGIFVPNCFGFVSLQSISAIDGAFIFSLSPIFTMILAFVWLRERFNKVQLVGVVLTIVSVLVILSHGKLDTIGRIKLVSGDNWMLVNALAFAFYTVVLKKYSVPLSAVAMLVVIMLFGACFAAIPTMYEWARGITADYTMPNIIGVVLYVGIVACAGAYMFFNMGTVRAGAAMSGLLVYTMPVFSTLISVIFFKEHLYAFHYTGMGLIMIGILITARFAQLKDA